MPALRRPRDLAASAHDLQRAAGHLQRTASQPDAVELLPTALAHVEEALIRLSTATTLAANAVADHEAPDGTAPEALAPTARALRWHLAHLAARLRAASDACPETRRWARDLLREHDAAERPQAAEADRAAA